MSKIIPSVYKIDLEKLSSRVRQIETGEQLALTPNNLVRTLDVHKAISVVQDFNREQGLTNARPFELLVNGVQQVDNASIAVYGKSYEGPHEWQDLFEQNIGNLRVERQNLAAFIVVDDQCYAISAGTGYTMFEQYIDTSFPLEIAKRIMSPEVDGTSERAINGAIYGRIQQFRSSQPVVSSQNLGTIWQGIQGKVNSAFQQSQSFSELFDKYASKTGLEAGSALKIRRSMSIKKIVDLISWLQAQLATEPTDEQKQAFKFLDSLSEVSPRKYKELILSLEDQIAGDIYAKLSAGKRIQDYDFCHKEMMLYLSADVYGFQNEELELAKSFDDNMPPGAHEVLKTVFDVTSPSNKQEFLEVLKSEVFVSHHESDARDSRGASVLEHLNGEVQLGSESYFLIDQKWYKASGAFVDRVKEDFKQLLETEFFQPSADGLKPYQHSKEGDYNESYANQVDWLVADRALLSNVELADIFHFADDKIYVVHNKLGFDVKIRDVCSQILHSMNILEQIKNTSDEDRLKEYYSKITSMSYYSKARPKISEADFVKKILTTSSKKITYILGYTTDLSNLNTSQSNIAKFETVKLCKVDKRAFDFELKIVDIKAIQS